MMPRVHTSNPFLLWSSVFLLGEESDMVPIIFQMIDTKVEFSSLEILFSLI